MSKALIFISYHPGSLPDYEYIKNTIAGKTKTILVLCKHAYLSQEIIELYSRKFDSFIYLPEIDYETNIIRGLARYFKYRKTFLNNIEPLLAQVDEFHVFSDFSAYLSVNALLKQLGKNKKCGRFISIREDYHGERENDYGRTFRAVFYTCLLGLQAIYAHKALSYLYIREPSNIIVKVLNPYEKWYPKEGEHPGNKPRFHIQRKPISREIPLEGKDIIIFYSDKQLEQFPCLLPKDEYERKLSGFFMALAEHYNGCKIICKPHPTDKGKTPKEMDCINFELYTGTLTSQMQLNAIFNRVRACYSISSTSLLYAAAQGIPAYTIYRYLEYNGKYPGEHFENKEVAEITFLYNLRSIEEIGHIDSLAAKPVEEQALVSLEELIK